MNLLLFYFNLLFTVIVNALPQVPYDYIPIGRQARRLEVGIHPSDVILNHERMFPARRKWID